MIASVALSPYHLEQIVRQILVSHKITRQDQQQLMMLLSNHVLSPQEEGWISQLHNALRQGLLRVVD